MAEIVMTAKELLKQLEELRRERPDFDTLEVYVRIIDRRSYDEDQRMREAGVFNEVLETEVGEGSVFEIVVPTDFDIKDEEFTPLTTYILLVAVELEDEPAEETEPSGG